MAFDDDAAMKKKWKAFVRKIDTKTDDYGTVLRAIKTFLMKPFMVTIESKEFAAQWTAQNTEWM